MQLGYHPIPGEIEAVLSRGPFTRALVIDEAVVELFDAVAATRVGDLPDAALPAGLYWFTGIDEPIVMQVGSGPVGPADELEIDAWNDSDDHPLIEAGHWAEALWAEAREVPQPKFAVGDRVITRPGDMDAEVRSRAFDAGSWSYRFRGDGGLRTELEHKLEPIDTLEEPAEWVTGPMSTAAHFGATLTRAKLNGRFVDTIYSFQATRTVFRPYQFKPVLKMLQSGHARILIADEVGLGKTIEAGLIWTELEARHEADRVLIVCPSSLVEKWRDEMEERFGFHLIQLDSGEMRRFLEQHRKGNVPKRIAYVASLEALRTWKALEELEDNPPEFDLVIVDEAHSMRNTDTASYKLGAQLSEWTIGSNMVFLTATPINLHETDLLHLLSLLEPADFDSIESLEARLKPNAILNEVGQMLTRPEVVAADFNEVLSGLRGLVLERAVMLRPEFGELTEVLGRAPLNPKDIVAARRLISELNVLSSTVTRTRRAEVDEKKSLRDAEPGIRVSWSPAESAFYREYLRWCQDRADLAGTPMYFSMQMPIRLASTSLHVAALQLLGPDAEFWEGDADTWVEDLDAWAEDPDQGRSGSWIRPHPELVAAAQRVLEVPDTKLNSLRDVLDELNALGRQALLFTWSKATLRYLRDTFGDRYRIAILNGDVKSTQRQRIMKDFRAGGYDFVFANRVASEGLDFEFCSAVVNYDLPWNPMEIEQRIGRIDRIGQQSDKILIRNFYNEEAIDSRIMFKVLQRIQIFERSIGELEPIVGNHLKELRAAIDFRLTTVQQEEKARQFLTAIEAQRAGLKEVAESAAGLIISNDVEVAGLEDELLSSGRYIGQQELAHLLDDWARSDDGHALHWNDHGHTVELQGSTKMASRLVELTELGRRTANETRSLISDLRNGAPITLAVDQDVALRTGVDLLSATHPLIMAAAEVPGHRQARFASVRVPASNEVPAGRYVVVLAEAQHASRGGDEIWGAAVDMNGRSAGEAPVDALFAALARGTLRDARTHDDDLPRLVKRAQRELERRHRDTQEKRDLEEGALTESRRALLGEQHERRMRGIQRRMTTMETRNRGYNVRRMVEGQLRRQRERHAALIAELETRQPKAVALRYLAVCVLVAES